VQQYKKSLKAIISTTFQSIFLYFLSGNSIFGGMSIKRSPVYAFSNSTDIHQFLFLTIWYL